MITEKLKKQLKKDLNQIDDRLPIVFEALKDKTRFKLVSILLSTKEDICVSEFADLLKISVPAVSQQLKLLERTGIVCAHKHGQTVCYKIASNDKQSKSIIAVVKRFLNI